MSSSSGECVYQYASHKNTNISIEASAGTGKTYTIRKIIRQFIESIDDPVPLSKVAIITFTEKAAQELRSRIREEIEDIGNSGDAHHGFRKEQLSEAYIGTIHGFARTILRDYADRTGFSVEYEEERNAKSIYQRVFEDFFWRLDAKAPEDFQVLLNFTGYKGLQGMLIECAEKTHVRPFTLDKGLGSKKILEDLAGELCFGLQKIADERKDKAKGKIESELEIISQIPWEIWGEDPSSPSQEFIQALDEHYFREKRPGIWTAKWKLDGNLNRKDQFDAIRSSKFGKSLLGITEEWIQNLQNIRSNFYLEAFEKYGNQFIESIQDYLKQNDTITLDWILLKSRDLLLNERSALEEIREAYRYIIVDECQDTNPIQSEILESICQDGQPALILVGDPKQSIYGFQNSDLESYFRMKDRVSKNSPGLKLQNTYRSSQRLMEIINPFSAALFPKNGSGRPPISYDWVTSKVATPNSNLNSGAVLHLFGANTDGSFRAMEEDVTIEEKQVADWISEWIVQNVGDNSSLFVHETDKSGNVEVRKPRLSDIAILFRTSTRLELLQHSLVEKHIPYSLAKSRGFFQEPLVEAVAHLLLALENPQNTESLAIALNSDLFLVELDEIQRLKELDYLSGLKFGKLARIFETLETAHRQKDSREAGSILYQIFLDNDIFRKLSIGPLGRRNRSNLYHCIEYLNSSQWKDSLSFGQLARDFYSAITEKREEALHLDADANDEVVNLITMHSSKGLEYPIVIFFGTLASENRNFPHILLNRNNSGPLPQLYANFSGTVQSPHYSTVKNEEKMRAEQETLRLFYVAITRAKNHLVIPGIIKMNQNGTSSTPQAKLLQDCISPNLEEWNKKGLVEIYTEKDLTKTKQVYKRTKKESDAKTTEESEPGQLFPRIQDFQESFRYKLNSYSSLARTIPPEEEEKTDQEAIPSENNFPGQKGMGAKFGNVCHSLLEIAPAEIWGDEAKARKFFLERVEEKFREFELALYSEGNGYSRNDAVEYCTKAACKKYDMGEQLFSHPGEWKYFRREKSFLESMLLEQNQFMFGIADGMFLFRDKYYLLDWKTNRLDSYQMDFLKKAVEQEYSFQYKIYSWVFFRNLTYGCETADEKINLWNEKFGGMLYIFLRETQDNQGSILLKPDGSEILKIEQLIQTSQWRELHAS